LVEYGRLSEGWVVEDMAGSFGKEQAEVPVDIPMVSEESPVAPSERSHAAHAVFVASL